MKKVLFLTSHLFSGSSAYFDILNLNHRIQGHRLEMAYGSPQAYKHLTDNRHKLNTRAAVWMDELLFSHLFSTESFYSGGKFIYIVRDPIPTLNGIVSHHKYSPEGATRYYCYRLGRICEMAKRTPGAILLLWEDLQTGRFNEEVEKYLNLKTNILNSSNYFEAYQKESPDVIPTEMKKWAERSYERHLYFLKKQDLRYWK
jgi:hypothetical protein